MISAGRSSLELMVRPALLAAATFDPQAQAIAVVRELDDRAVLGGMLDVAHPSEQHGRRARP